MCVKVAVAPLTQFVCLLLLILIGVVLKFIRLSRVLERKTIMSCILDCRVWFVNLCLQDHFVRILNWVVIDAPGRRRVGLKCTNTIYANTLSIQRIMPYDRLH